MVFERFKQIVPYIIDDTPIPMIIRAGKLIVPEYREKSYFIVLSVDVGNTTTDCIILGTNLETGITYMINNATRMTRDIRSPKEGEEIFGQTLEGMVVSQCAVIEFVRDIILDCAKTANIDLKKDLDFVVYCTGLVASWESPEDVSTYIGSLAKGCLEAGISGSKMTLPLRKSSLRPDLQKHSLADKVNYCGTIAGVVPPAGIAGKHVIANELEGDLGMAGIKEGALHSPVDFRNPCISIDFGTILDGRITENVPDERDDPHAATIGCFVGLGSAIADAMVRGTGEVDPIYGCARDFFGDESVIATLPKRQTGVVKEYMNQIHDYLKICVIPRGTTHFGKVPVDENISENTGMVMIGVDCGKNFSNQDTVKMLGADIYKKHGKKVFADVVDRVCAQIALRLIDVASEEGLVHPNSAIGFSGRGALSGRKPEYILKGIMDRGIYKNPQERVIFVSNALPRGASLMARCMGSLGKPDKPIGGVRGGKCILDRRRKVGK